MSSTTYPSQPSYPHQHPTAPGGGSASSVPGDSYFTESRKGEINELRNLLRGFSAERDPVRKRDIIKKVLAYMTLGIDVSRLFTEMMLAIETRYVSLYWRFGDCGRSMCSYVSTNKILILFVIPTTWLGTWSLKRWCTST